jgi:hypothetical protein
LELVEDASHWPQWDQPELVAQLIKQATSGRSTAGGQAIEVTFNEATRKPPEEPAGFAPPGISSASVW